MKKILLTRQVDNNKKIKPILEAKGYKVVEQEFIKYYPSLEVIETIDLTDKIIIVTSNYAAKLISLHPANFLNCRAYVVGKESSRILKNAGVNILSHGKNIFELMAKIPNTADLVYLRGNIISQRMPFRCTEYQIYKTEYSQEFDNEIFEAIQNSELDIISVFSIETAKAIILASSNPAILDKIKNVKFYCFSKKIADFFELKNLYSKYPKTPDIRKYLNLF